MTFTLSFTGTPEEFQALLDSVRGDRRATVSDAQLAQLSDNVAALKVSSAALRGAIPPATTI